TGALTATTALGRNLFPESEFDLGVAGGFGAPAAMERIRQADVAVVFGPSLNQFTMRFGELFHPSTSVWQVDTDHRATIGRCAGSAPVGATRAAAQLVSRLRTCAPEPDARRSGPWRETVDTAADRAREAGTEFASDGRRDPRAAAARLGELLPSDRVVVSDGGHFIAWANMFWEPNAPDRMAMVGTAFQSIGLGWHRVAGATRANQDSTIVLTTGDGGGAMALSDLDTAIRSA